MGKNHILYFNTLLVWVFFVHVEGLWMLRIANLDIRLILEINE